VSLQRLSLTGFRNLTAQGLQFEAGRTVVVGANGSGKTNLLEAVAVFGNLASFRAGSSTAWVQRGKTAFSFAGVVRRGGVEVELRQEARAGRTLTRVLSRGGRRLGAAEYLSLFPVTALSGQDRQLVWGTPEDRRRFLDRLCFHLHAEALPVLQRYRRVLRQRNALLSGGGRDAEFDAFEHDLARLGARIVGFRQEAVDGLERHLGEELEALGWSLSRPHLLYNSPDGVAVAEPATLAVRLRAALAASRRRERARGHTAVGPHRHDLFLTVQGVPAREVLSAGQGKLVATALKLAAMALLSDVRGRVPTVVFDDVDAELDAAVLRRVLARLKRGVQALLSSAHEEMVLPRLAGGAVWRMHAGTVEVVSAGG
jgi:DNA replication and repair protein RecF